MRLKQDKMKFIIAQCPVCRYPFATCIGTLLHGCVQCMYVWYKDKSSGLQQQSKRVP